MTADRWRTIVAHRIAAGATWDAALDPIVAEAVELVRLHGFDRRVDLGPGRISVGTLTDCEGLITRGRIWLACDGVAYDFALHGDVRALAGVLAHEVAHAEGCDEYDATL